MFIDGRSVPDGESIDTDVCIIGTGPAGITLGLRIIGAVSRPTRRSRVLQVSLTGIESARRAKRWPSTLGKRRAPLVKGHVEWHAVLRDDELVPTVICERVVEPGGNHRELAGGD